MRKLRVLQVLPALDGGGVERGTLEIARALVARGHESLVLSRGGRLVAQLEREGSRHIAMDLGRKSPLTFLKYRQVRRLLAAERVDVLHVRSRLPAWACWLAWRGMPPGSRPRYVTTVHGMHSVSRYSAIMATGERVVAVSDTVHDYIRQHYSGAHWPHCDMAKVVTIHRGVAPAEFPWQYRPPAQWLADFRAQWPQLAGRRLLVLPGRMTRLKGHHDFIAVIAALLAQGHDVAGLVVGGDDPKRPAYAREVRDRVQAAGLADRIVFLGHRSDMRELYAVADAVLTLSNKPESFGRTVLEALALGRPVVGYAHGGVAEILAALFPFGAVPVGDRDAVTARLGALLAGQAPAVRPNERFLLADMQARTLALYEELAP